MILYRAYHAWMVWPVSDGRFEDDSLVVALTLALGLDAIAACRALLATLDATFPTCQTTSLRPLSHL